MQQRDKTRHSIRSEHDSQVLSPANGAAHDSCQMCAEDLKQTQDLNLTYVKNSPEVIGYSDADWAGDMKDRWSTSGNVFLLGGGAITWSSRKQSSVALSTVEAEYMALSVATQEAIWLRQLQEELGVTEAGPSRIYEDNQGAISI